MTNRHRGRSKLGSRQEGQQALSHGRKGRLAFRSLLFMGVLLSWPALAFWAATSLPQAGPMTGDSAQPTWTLACGGNDCINWGAR